MSVEIKCAVVGASKVGKTCLLATYYANKFPSDYIPTVYDPFVVYVGDNNLRLSIWDTAGADIYDRLRPLSYPKTQIYLLCFSVDDHDSFDSLTTKWIKEIKSNASEKKYCVVLVGTKTDLRKEKNCITEEEGRKMAGTIGATAYFECSAMNGIGVKEVFDGAVEAFKGGENDNEYLANGSSGKCILM